MRGPARFIGAIALAAVSVVRLPVAPTADAAQPSLPSVLASFLTEEAHATPCKLGDCVLKLDEERLQTVTHIG
jgi:hypothetical protein